MVLLCQSLRSRNNERFNSYIVKTHSKNQYIYQSTYYYGCPGGTFLLISYHLLLTTYYLSLITYYLLLITYYLLIITYHIIYHAYNGGKPHCTFLVIAVEYGSPYLLISSSSSSKNSSSKSGSLSSRKTG